MRFFASLFAALLVSVPARAVYISDGNIGCDIESPQGVVSIGKNVATFKSMLGPETNYRFVVRTEPSGPSFFALSKSFKKTFTIYGVSVDIACIALNHRAGGACTEARTWGRGHFSVSCRGCAEGDGLIGTACKKSNVQFIRQ